MKPRIRIRAKHWYVRCPGEFYERHVGRVGAIPLSTVVAFALEYAKVPY